MHQMSGLEPPFRDYWYPVARLQLDAPPHHTRILERDYVLYSIGGEASIRDLRCPHRGADLSRGQVQERSLVCPYHGLRFDGQGRCSQDLAEPAARHMTKQDGLLWVAPGALPVAPPILISKYVPPERRRFIVGPISWNASAPQIADNFVDVSHFAFVHEQTIGKSDTNPRLDIVEETEDGFVFTYRHRAKRIIGGGNYATLRRTLTYTFLDPFIVIINITYDDLIGENDIIVLIIVPIDVGRSHFFKIVSTTRIDLSHEQMEAEARLQKEMTEEDRLISEALPSFYPLAAPSIRVPFDEPAELLRMHLLRKLA